MGRTIEGSPNVIVGDLTAGANRNKPVSNGHKIEIQLVIDSTGVPLKGVKYELIDEHGGVVARGTTDKKGMILHNPIKEGMYSVRIFGGWEVANGQ
jgi:uncharacterized protein YfaS (alpha-2-macroglobulin family)